MIKWMVFSCCLLNQKGKKNVIRGKEGTHSIIVRRETRRGGGSWEREGKGRRGEEDSGFPVYLSTLWESFLAPASDLKLG